MSDKENNDNTPNEAPPLSVEAPKEPDAFAQQVDDRLLQLDMELKATLQHLSDQANTILDAAKNYADECKAVKALWKEPLKKEKAEAERLQTIAPIVQTTTGAISFVEGEGPQSKRNKMM